MLILIIQPWQASFAMSIAWLSTSGRYITDPNGKTVILRDVSLVNISVADTRTRPTNMLIDKATDHVNGWYACLRM